MLYILTQSTDINTQNTDINTQNTDINTQNTNINTQSTDINTKSRHTVLNKTFYNRSRHSTCRSIDINTKSRCYQNVTQKAYRVSILTQTYSINKMFYNINTQRQLALPQAP